LGRFLPKRKIIPKEKRISPNVEKEDHSYIVKDSPLNQTFSLRERPLGSKLSLPKEKERCLKISSEENKHINMLLTSKINPQVKALSFNKNETSEDPRRREKAPKMCPPPEDRTLKLKIETFKSKINLSRWRST